MSQSDIEFYTNVYYILMTISIVLLIYFMYKGFKDDNFNL